MSARAWRRVLGAVAGVAAAALALGLFLFSGSAVACAEERGDAGPALRCAFEVAAAPDAVWAAFAGTDRPRPFYFDAVLQADLRPGGRWRFVNEDRSRLLASGTILTFDPERRRFAQTFTAADLDEPPSRITVELAPVPGGTRVALVHDGFATETTTYRRFRRAHPLALSALKTVLETGELPLRARIYTALFKPGMNRVAARAEPWD